MRIPASLAPDPVTLHRPESWDDILERTRQDMVQPRLAIRRRRPFVENKLPFRRFFVQRFLENLLLVPILEHLFFQFREAYFGVDFFHRYKTKNPQHKTIVSRTISIVVPPCFTRHNMRSILGAAFISRCYAAPAIGSTFCLPADFSLRLRSDRSFIAFAFVRLAYHPELQKSTWQSAATAMRPSEICLPTT